MGGTIALGVLAFVLFHSPAVPVDPPSLSAEQAVACQRLQARLPELLDGRGRRDTEPASAATAAWGDPPVVLRCGVARPSALELTSQLFQADGVSWFAERLSGGWRFTATGRATYVEVTVPGAEQQASGELVDLAAAVSAALPPRGDGGP